MHRSSWLLVLLSGWCAHTSLAAPTLQEGPPRITLSEKNNLASLVDLCAVRLDLNLEYDAEALRRIDVTLRLGRGVTDRELWTLTNRLLAAHDFTTIRMAGESTLSVVKLADAQKKSRFQDASALSLEDGFSTAVLRVRQARVSDLIQAVKPLLSQPGGNVVRLGETDFILIADLTPRLMEVLEVVERLDSGDRSPSVIERIALAHLEATELVAQVTAAVEARNAIEPRPLPGTLSPSLDGESVILVTPSISAPTWRDLIQQFDQRRPVETRSYLPIHFALTDVAALIEQTAKRLRGGAGDRWSIVTDQLSGALIITATREEHEQIAALITRLDALPPESHRLLKSFVIRNRSVTELLEVLKELMEDDALAEGSEPDRTSSAQSKATDERETEREPSSNGNGPAQSGTPSRGSVRAVSGRSLTLTADEQTNTLIAIGEPRMLTQLEALLRILDVRQPQVELEVFVVSLTEGDTLDLGIELQKLEVSGRTLIGLSSLFGLTDLTVDSDSPLTGGRGFSGVVLSPGDFSVVVRALKTLNTGVSKSYPRILVNNNEQATLDAVLQEPFSSINASDTVATTSFGDFVDAGTQVTVTPHIAEGDHLVLEYNVTLSAFVGESSDPNLPPPRQQTMLQSVVTIPDGYAIAVGGLEVVSEAEAVSQIPLLGDLPIIGELFKNRSRSQSRSRFYVFIRANVLRHDGFEDLKYLSDREAVAADFDDGWPVLEPRVIK